MKKNNKLNIEELKIAVFEKNEADKRNKDRLFKLAKANDDIETIEKLRNEFEFKGARVYLDKLANRSLDDAVKNRDVKLLEKLINKGIDVTYIDILELIIKKYEVDFIKLLIQKEDINKKDKDGRTIIFHASNYNHLPLLLWALSNGGNPNISDFRDATPLLVASQYGFIEIVKNLLDMGAKLNLQANDNATPLSQASLTGHYEIVELLLNKGAIVTVEALFFPVQNNDFEILKLILSKKVNVDLVREEDGVSPLMIASQLGFTNIVRVLIKNKVNINHQDKSGDTALLLAVSRNHTDIVNLLIENYAYVNIRAKDNISAFDKAWENNNREIMNVLIKAGATESKVKGMPLINKILDTGDTLLTIHVLENDVSIVDFWLKNGADVNITNRDGNTPLLLAVGLGYVDMVELLLKNGANVSIKSCENAQAIEYAVYHNYLDIVRKLLEYGANVNRLNYKGQSILETASYEGYTEVVKLLLEYKPDINHQNETAGMSALMLGAGKQNLEICEILIQAGADVNLLSRKNHLNALDILIRDIDDSEEDKILPIIKLLVKHNIDIKNLAHFPEKKKENFSFGLSLNNLYIGTILEIAHLWGYRKIESSIQNLKDNQLLGSFEVVEKEATGIVYKNYIILLTNDKRIGKSDEKKSKD